MGDFIKFLGTAGARFVMIRQLRNSGGIWISCEGANVLIDPGPGSIVHCAKSRPKLDPCSLDAVILTHRHLDHSNDINVMIEAMTEGGFKKRGEVFCPADALEGDPVIFKYLRQAPERIQLIRANQSYQTGNFIFSTSMRHIHPVETYGLKFKINGKEVGLLTDTRYFAQLADFYDVEMLIAGVVFREPRPGIDHLSVAELKGLILGLKSKGRLKKVILTHFGMSMLKAKPRNVAMDLARETGVDVIAATDGMTAGLDNE
ncbi:MAG: MBL fold metallo-hydrolase [Candidatus Omnitrophica bacterium]|nr:MBL fold metallo-hydrolase [Candidatus Omnitrophota bacterium]